MRRRWRFTEPCFALVVITALLSFRREEAPMGLYSMGGARVGSMSLRRIQAPGREKIRKSPWCYRFVVEKLKDAPMTTAECSTRGALAYSQIE
ncbi:hypothetical protein M427DRAFT_476885 [Gonapodya prolifera JEL478]|uniref:Uncharacterized protein n=1 Tax=Gonapodya prolifera (strain JEL478) TaxID=1344416 RepID=A0A139A107_GONPJ|nr:hypothetical protein M427DRAFT_476885 [Gonapodya prolifera JEL478]|eukprot:KXS10467.1 hypothetical protein M427DRAFT_476885 [Gonapodya prolifera JEL478]